MNELKKGARITGQQRDDLAVDFGKRYQAGESVRSLAS
ncbi:MAG: helix-turn-helix domain-containing protein, partial [Actinomycetota bacterium]|nr:helix-turn-helix domain-containing protein [Actinomycetota bacterium]